MNEAAFLADLRSKVLWMGQPTTIPDGGDGTEMKVSIIQMGLKGTVKGPAPYQYVVVNKGVVPGPQTYSSDVFETDENGDPVDPPVLLHAAGDPILDENGDQIVIPEFMGESAYPRNTIDLPLPDALIGAQVLVDGVTNGDWAHFDNVRPNPAYGFIEFDAAIVNQDGTHTWVKKKASYDAQGNATVVDVV